MRAYRSVAGGVDLPVTDDAADAALSMPLWTDMTEAHIERLASAFHRIRTHAGATSS
jgi:dTDP-4-amino-4,6-dideoxygalactose transaminase